MSKTSKLQWYFNRLKRMELPAELFYRLFQQFQLKIVDRIQRGKKIKKAPEFEAEMNIKLSAERYQLFLPKVFNFNKHRVFSVELTSLLGLKNWQTDPKTRREAPNSFSNALNLQSYSQLGDIKYTFELSRLRYLPFLQLHAQMTDDAELKKVVKLHLLQFIEQNPYLSGVNWTKGIEVAIRAINLLLCRRLMKPGEMGKDFVSSYDRYLILHLHYLNSHLSLYSSSNNHLIAELTGILVISGFYDMKRNGRRFESALKQLEKALSKLLTDEGWLKEQSFNYHREVTEYLMILHCLFKRHEIYLKSSLPQCLQTMIENLAWFEQNGLTRVGDADDGSAILPFFDSSWNLTDSLLDLAKLYFPEAHGSSTGEVQIESHDLYALLLLGDQYKQLEQAQIHGKPKNTVTNRLEERAGYFSLRDEPLLMTLDAAEFGFQPLNAHAHADSLHINLFVEGMPVLVDPGTYQYHERHAFWRNYFRGTSAHNTIGIDKLDQAVPMGRMMWGDGPVAQAERANEVASRIEISAEHNGYAAIGVTHQRRLANTPGSHKITMTDQLSGEGEHRASFYLHFHPSITGMKLSDDHLIIPVGNERLLLIKNAYFGMAELFKGNKHLPLGWYSAAFDQLQECYSLRLNLDFRSNLELVTEFSLAESN